MTLAHPALPGPVASGPKPSRPSIINPHSSPMIPNFSRTLARSANECRIDISISLTSDRKGVTHSLRQDRCGVTNASPTSSSHQDVPIRPPHHSTPPPGNLPPPRFLGLLDPVSIDAVSDGTVQLRKGRRRPSFGRGFSRVHNNIPVPKLDYDLPADFGERVSSRSCPLY